MDKLQTQFNHRFFTIDREYLLSFNKVANQGQINNVITGLERNFFNLSVDKDETLLEYSLMFGTNFPDLNGFRLELNSNVKERDELSFLFARYISENVKDLNIIDVFNTFQRSIRSMYEHYDYITYNPQDLKDLKDPNPLILTKGKRGIIAVVELNKNDFYKSFFKGFDKKGFIDGEEHVYLMYNSRNDLVKIGQSKTPNYREKTLQSEEPEIELICKWKAPKAIEKELHKKFSSKRKRGEWFELSFIDLEKIKKRMAEYE